MDRFPEKKVNYRDLLRVVTEDENIGFARWLVGTFFNPFDELVESNVHCKHIFFPGSVMCHGDLVAQGSVFVGAGIHIRGDLIVSGDIFAGGNIIVEGNILSDGGGIESKMGDIFSAKNIKSLGLISSGGYTTAQLGIESHFGAIESKGSISAKNGSINSLLMITSGDGVYSGGDIVCRGVIAATNIHARGIIDSRGYGVFAGTRVAVGEWGQKATVMSQVMPRDFVSGAWKLFHEQPENGEEC